MDRTVYLNGNYINPDKAKVSIFDRELLFGDAIYEVASVIEIYCDEKSLQNQGLSRLLYSP